MALRVLTGAEAHNLQDTKVADLQSYPIHTHPAPLPPVFLILWIILNITSSFQPIELMEKFYHFLRWLPFVNIVEVGFDV